MIHKLHTFCFVLLAVQYSMSTWGLSAPTPTAKLDFMDLSFNTIFPSCLPSSYILSPGVLISLSPSYCCTCLFSVHHIILTQLLHFQTFSVKYFHIKSEMILKNMQCVLNWLDLICHWASWKKIWRSQKDRKWIIKFTLMDFIVFSSTVSPVAYTAPWWSKLLLQSSCNIFYPSFVEILAWL